MRFIQETTPDSGTVLIRTTTVSMTEQELNWLIEGLDALILPDRAKRIKRALTRALGEMEEAGAMAVDEAEEERVEVEGEARVPNTKKAPVGMTPTE